MKLAPGFALSFLLLAIVVIGCRCGPEPPRPTPSPSASPRPSPTAGDATYRRVDSNVMAGLSEPLSSVNDDTPHELLRGMFVNTDSNGEARLKLAGCATYYLYESGKMIYDRCTKSEREGGGSCLVAGAMVYDGECANRLEQIVQTPTANIKPTGTWFIVVYLPEKELTLTVVLKGSVEVTPVKDIETRFLGEPATVIAGQFYLTATDKAANKDNLIAADRNKARPVEASPEIIRQYLAPWLTKIRKRAEEDKMPYSQNAFSEETPESADVIDCDCDHIDAGLLTRAWQEQCRSAEIKLRRAYAENHKIVGTCDGVAQGPNAKPKG